MFNLDKSLTGSVAFRPSACPKQRSLSCETLVWGWCQVGHWLFCFHRHHLFQCTVDGGQLLRGVNFPSVIVGEVDV